MLNVFIADDEIVIRESLRACALWSEGAFNLVGEAPDGELALSMMQDCKPDILITDIKMPFMDGLELSRQVRTTMPWMHIVILSGYDDFDFARQAITLGVTDYLLKPVDEIELRPVLEKIRTQIEQERREQKKLVVLREQERESLPLWQERLLQEALESETPPDARETVEKARALGINLRAAYYRMAIVKTLFARDRLTEYAQTMSALHRHAAGSGGAVLVTETGGWPTVLIMGDTREDLEERSYAFPQAVQFELEQACDVRTAIYLGGVTDSLAGIRDSLHDAQQLEQKSPGLDVRGGRIVSEDDAVPAVPVDLTDFAAQGSLDRQLRVIGKGEVQDCLDQLIRDTGMPALNSRVMGNYLYVQVLMAVTRLIRDQGENADQVLPHCFRDEREIAGLTAPELYHRLLDLLSVAVDFRDAREQGRYSEATMKALRYIQGHYQDVGVNMRDTARHVALSSSHFCTVFSQEVGMTFTEYLTKVRMEKARELLATTAMLSQDIATAVGYNDRHYFSYLFKKITGLSPIEYRKSRDPLA